MATINSNKIKILIIRFSSIGDVIQCLSVPTRLKQIFPDSEIHWVTRNDLSPILQNHPHIDRIHALRRQEGLLGLLKLCLALRRDKFSHIYDAHNNIRSRVILIFLSYFRWPSVFKLQRPIYRWKRFLLFRFRINTFKMPFSGQRDLLDPLVKWENHMTQPSEIFSTLPPAPQYFPLEAEINDVKNQVHFDHFWALAPSAAYFLKRWPRDYWIRLIELFPSKNFVLLGGPGDSFLEDIAKICPSRILNLSGRTTLRQSAAIISRSEILICNDTGMLHFAEQLGHPCVALMGPAPFGFPSRSTTRILERNLVCRPCSKHGQGPCKNRVKYHQCLVDLTPEFVKNMILARLSIESEVTCDI